MKLLPNAANFFDRLITFLAYTAGALMAVAAIAIGANALTRSLFQFSITGSIEISEFILLWIPFLAAAWLLREDGHVRVDIVLNQLKSRQALLLNIATSIIGIIICFIVFWYSAQITAQYFIEDVRIPALIRYPKAPILMIIPMGSLLLSIQFTRMTRRYFKDWKTTPAENKAGEGDT